MSSHTKQTNNFLLNMATARNNMNIIINMVSHILGIIPITWAQ